MQKDWEKGLQRWTSAHVTISVARKDPWLLLRSGTRLLVQTGLLPATPSPASASLNTATQNTATDTAAAELEDLGRQETYPAAVLTQTLDW